MSHLDKIVRKVTESAEQRRDAYICAAITGLCAIEKRGDASRQAEERWISNIGKLAVAIADEAINTANETGATYER